VGPVLGLADVGGEVAGGDGVGDAVADAVDELWAGGQRGDILVFMPGEREIREGADHLRRHLAQALKGGPPPEVLPLFARLSPAEQAARKSSHPPSNHSFPRTTRTPRVPQTLSQELQGLNLLFPTLRYDSTQVVEKYHRMQDGHDREHLLKLDHISHDRM
jgi:hypothetical protein